MKLLCEQCRPSLGASVNPGPCANCGAIGTHFTFDDFAVAVRPPDPQSWSINDDDAPTDLVEAAAVIETIAEVLSSPPEREAEDAPEFVGAGGSGGGGGARGEF